MLSPPTRQTCSSCRTRCPGREFWRVGSEWTRWLSRFRRDGRPRCPTCGSTSTRPDPKGSSRQRCKEPDCAALLTSDRNADCVPPPTETDLTRVRCSKKQPHASDYYWLATDELTGHDRIQQCES